MSVLKFSVFAALVLASACTATPTNDGTAPAGQAYDGLWGASYAETCAVLVPRLCSSKPCEGAMMDMCSVHGADIVYAPSQAAWDDMWSKCLASIASDVYSFECRELLPAP